MATTLPSPPPSRSITPDTHADPPNLTAQLDALLAQYLHLLDQYTALRTQLSATLSSGFFSLAQAQRTNTLGPGRRYGRDCYDGRMKAQRRVNFTRDEEGDVRVWVGREIPVLHSSEGETNGRIVEGAEAQRREGEGEGEVDGDDDAKKGEDRETNTEQEEDNENKGQRKKADPATRDPLTWFGILAPPALRQTQAHFVKAVDGDIPTLLTFDARMRRVEGEIWECRRELGIMGEYNVEDACGEAEREMKQEDEESEEIESMDRGEKVAAKKKGDGKPLVKRTSMPSRPVHGKSHLLKLGD